MAEDRERVHHGTSDLRLKQIETDYSERDHAPTLNLAANDDAGGVSRSNVKAALTCH